MRLSSSALTWSTFATGFADCVTPLTLQLGTNLDEVSAAYRTCRTTRFVLRIRFVFLVHENPLSLESEAATYSLHISSKSV